ncbi:MAG: tyrosine--tRNA ligase [Candidatus Portnoybacteria bacterium CG_4_8_14_3_um_filter_44_15]|uniref:Tyrosine--tRNA ligase n=2 Tax=Candidatus Portnoyibacteriota TaxID=1817913 RepID=A0A2M7IDM2_9BACT|nr:MAG: tyrosine--tRNA ligase [Candidatus Portnoybacteria bacterium CG_4_8_14_3_um_filter_44_15]
MDKEKQIQEVLNRGVENIYPSRQELEKILRSGKKLKLYCGYDPTATRLHIGNAITLRKLAQFQKLGHKVIMLIGDFTGMIGDPTDKTEARKKMTRDQVLKNSKNYQSQAAKILDFKGSNPAKILYNSDWNDKLTFIDLIELASNFTVGQMLVRDMFQERIKKDKPIYLHEFLYPLAQAYDSVAMNVDLEVGGNDQTFNMLCGRDLIKAVKDKEKFVLTLKLLVDPAGKKMGKSEGNVVWLDDEPNEMFGKVMSWPDEAIAPAMELATDISTEEIEETEKKIKEGKLNPRDAKARLARELVKIHHGAKQADQAEKEFNRVFKEKDKPTEMPVYQSKKEKMKLVDLLIKTKPSPSKSEARRLIEQGGVKIDDEVVKDWQKEIELKDGMVIQAGRRKFLQIKLQ